MSVADGERIAPVTYLFGAAPAEETESGSSSSADVVEAPSIARVRFTAEPESESAPAETRVPKTKAPAKGSFDRVSNVSMYALARRGMSSREMRDYLIGREFEHAEVDEEITRLEGVGLLDDAQLAETLVRTLRDRKGLGRSALTAELRRRHLDALAIEQSLAVLEDDDELQRAIEIATKRAPQLRSLDADTAKRRLGAFLMRKGYSGSVVSAAVQQALVPSGPRFR